MLEFRHHPPQMKIISTKRKKKFVVFLQLPVGTFRQQISFFVYESYPQFCEKSIVFGFDMRDN
jgi:hypothetical protein